MKKCIIYRFICILIIIRLKIKLAKCNPSSEVSGDASQKADESESTHQDSTTSASSLRADDGSISHSGVNTGESGAEQEQNTQTCLPTSEKPEESKQFQVETIDETNRNNRKTNDESKYTFCTLKYGFKYIFNKEALCVQVKHNYKTVWQYDQHLHGDTYPKLVYYSTYFKRLVIVLSNKWFYAYDLVQNAWEFNHYKSKLKGSYYKLEETEKYKNDDYEDTLKYTHLLNTDDNESILSTSTQLTTPEEVILKPEITPEEEIKPEHFKFYTADRSDENTIHEIEYSKYTLKDLHFGFKFIFNEDVQCHEVKHKDQTVWKYNEEEHEKTYPKSVYYNKYFKRLIVILNNKWFYAYEYTFNYWEYSYEKSEGKACDYSLKIPEDIDTIDYFDRSTRYYITRKKSKITFTFKEYTNCAEVQVADKVVWKHKSSEHKNKYPTSVTYNTNGYTVSIKFSENKCYSYKLQDDTWEPYSALSWS